MLFFLLACEGANDTAPATTDDSAAPVGDFLCASGETIAVSVADYAGAGTAHYEWNIDHDFLEAGGEWAPVDGPTVEVTCPACGESAVYAVNVVMIGSDDTQKWAYTTIAQTCD